MLVDDHRRRVARLLRGDLRVTDLDRLFADLRLARPSRASVQEIGHFAAHRDERDTGISLVRANDIQTSARLWHRQFNGVTPTADHLREAGRANLDIMPEDRVRERFGISMQTAKQSFARAMRKFEAGRPLKAREAEVLKVFGLSMMWQYAFSDQQLVADMAELLVAEDALAMEDRHRFLDLSRFIPLYALSIMHGARLRMADGASTRLRLATSEEGGFLRIKAEIPIGDTPKPVTTSVPLFETALNADEHCDPAVLTELDNLVPVEVEGFRLVPLG